MPWASAAWKTSSGEGFRHRQPSAGHVLVGDFDQGFALDGVAILLEHLGVHDRSDGHAGLVEVIHVLSQRPLGDPTADDGIEFLPVLQPCRIVGEARVGDHVLPPDGAEQFLRHALGGGG